MILAALLFFMGSPKDVAFQQVFLSGKQTLERGYSATDLALLKSADRIFDQIGEAYSDPLVFYYQGLTNYRILNCLNMQGNQTYREQSPYLDKAISCLEKIQNSNPTYMEACVLLHNLYGRKIGFKPMLGLSLLPKMKKMGEIARQMEPENPRWLLMEAVYDYHAPKRFGGDREKALMGFEKAASVLASRAQSEFGSPDWGLTDAYAWLGICYSDAGENDLAKRYFDKALEVDPNFGWVKKYLYPRLVNSGYSSHAAK